MFQENRWTVGAILDSYNITYLVKLLHPARLRERTTTKEGEGENDIEMVLKHHNESLLHELRVSQQDRISLRKTLQEQQKEKKRMQGM